MFVLLFDVVKEKKISLFERYLYCSRTGPVGLRKIGPVDRASLVCFCLRDLGVVFDIRSTFGTRIVGRMI